MTINETMEYLNSFAAWDPDAIASGEAVMGLDALAEVLSLLGNPQDQFRAIHIAGTNGKGSVAAFLQHILVESGYRTGMFTSPYLSRFTEEIRINAMEVSMEEVAQAATELRDAARELEERVNLRLTKFEAECAIAFLCFARGGCEVAVLETGLGGRLDATNVIKVPDLAVITGISIDHTQILGDTREAIALEKAGIIKRGGKVLLYPQVPEVREIFEKTCEEQKAELYDAVMPEGETFFSLSETRFDLLPKSEKEEEIIGTGGFHDLCLHIAGHYQIYNAAMAVNAACLLAGAGYHITEESMRKGLSATSWPGRFEMMQTNPLVFVDGGHNAGGVEALTESLRQYFPGKKIIFVTGMLKDKDYEGMTDLVLPLAKCFFTLTPSSSRALDAKKLAECLRKKGAEATACESVEEAIEAALKHADRDDVICMFGSLYYIGKVRAYFAMKNQPPI